MRSRTASRERGAAYLLALLSLLALTGLGISLSRIASTERRLGWGYESRHQALRAAESALAMSEASLVAGRPPVASAVELSRTVRSRVSQVGLASWEAPLLLGADRCYACAADTPLKSRYRLAAVGERQVIDSKASPGDERMHSRVELEAIVTLQPWPPPTTRASSRDGRCLNEIVINRIASELLAELNPPECRPTGLETAVAGVDPGTQAACAIPVQVCAIRTDWRERWPP